MSNLVVPEGGVLDKVEVNAALSGAGSWSDPLIVNSGELVSVSVGGSFDATVVVQRQVDGMNWRSVPNSDGSVGWTGPTEQTYEADEGCWLRIGIDTGDYVSGTAQVRLGKG